MKFIQILLNSPSIYLYPILFHPLQLITKSKPSFFLSSIKIYTISSIYQEFYSFYIGAQQSTIKLISSIYLKKSYTIYHSITLSTYHLSIQQSSSIDSLHHAFHLSSIQILSIVYLKHIISMETCFNEFNISLHLTNTLISHISIDLNHSSFSIVLFI